MTERQPIVQSGEIQVPVRNLEVGEVFRPFKGLTRLPPLQRDLGDRSYALLGIPFQFKGITVNIVLNVLGFELVNNMFFSTPFGPVRFVSTIGYRDGFRVSEAPLDLTVGAVKVTSAEQLQELKRHTWEFKIGRKKFSLGFKTDLQDDYVSEKLERNGELFVGTEEVSVGDKDVAAILPYNLALLKKIEARIIERPQA